MNDLSALLHREAVYLWYYFTVRLEQILGWWVLGMLVGSAVSVFAKDAIRRALLSLRGGRAGALGIAVACGSQKALNLVLLGMFSRHLPFGEKAWQDAIASCVPQKTLEVNLAAFARGRALMN